MNIRIAVSLVGVSLFSMLRADVVEYDLVLKEVVHANEAGNPVVTMEVNGSALAPLLHFTEGDTAVIKVSNLTTAATSMHWHGIRIRNDQDGASHINSLPIKPGETATYKFPIQQYGTYWYYSHNVEQEQIGSYGAVIISPKQKTATAEKDVAVLVSDSTDQLPKEILRDLRRNNGYQQRKKGTYPTLWGAIQNDALGVWLKHSFRNMPLASRSDIAYNQFLANGEESLDIDAQPGEVICLRLINVATSSYFFVEYAGGPLRVIAADGINVEPVELGRFLMTPGETYDFLIKIPDDGNYELRLTEQDVTGYTSIFMGKGERKYAPDIKPRNIYSEADDGRAATIAEKSDAIIALDEDVEYPSAPYPLLKARDATVTSPDRPLREYKLVFDGDMFRYVWTINGKTFDETDPILIKEGERVRFTFINKSSVNHPMHLHGHFFQVRNQHGDYSPMKHTVDLPPRGEVTIEFDANQPGNWTLYCHIPYRTQMGMMLAIRYQGVETSAHYQPPKVIDEEHDSLFFWGEGVLLTNMSDGFVTMQNNRNALTASWELRWQNAKDSQYQIEPDYERFISSELSLFAGARFQEDENVALGGFRLLLPFFFKLKVSLDTDGNVRVTLDKEIQLTERISIFGEGRYDTADKWESYAGVGYYLYKNCSLIFKWHSDYGFGVGAKMSF